MNLILTFLILSIIFIIISFFYNYYYILKIKKHYNIIKKNNDNIFFNNIIIIFLVIYNLLLIVFFILSLLLDIISMSKNSSFIIDADFIAYSLLVVNMLYFIFSTFSFWYFNLLYPSIVFSIDEIELKTIFNSVNLSEILNIKTKKINIILINYGKYNDTLKIHTFSKIEAQKIFLFLKNNIKNIS